MQIRLAGIIENSLTNGEGIRKVIFAQGCRHNCKGCFNPETHSFTGGVLCDTDKIIESINNDKFIDGVTFSGGDPFEQPLEFAEIAKNINLSSIWCYTGYTFEYIMEEINNGNRPEWYELLKYIECLVDGKFDENKMGGKHKFRGSSNQRLINVPESLKCGEVVCIVDYDK